MASETEVSFDDAQGRRVLFKLNTAGYLDYYVDGKQKVQKVKELRAQGDCLHFDGKRVLCTEKEVPVPHDMSADIIKKVMSLTARATNPVTAMRCLVEVTSAAGLRGADVGGRSDPYCICGVVGKAHTRDRTKYKSRTTAPNWSEKLEIHDFKLGEDIEFIIMDHDYMSKDDFLGYAVVTSQELTSPARLFEGDLRLIDNSKYATKGRAKAKGTLRVRVQLLPDDPDFDIAAEASVVARDRDQEEQARPRAGTLTRSRAATARSRAASRAGEKEDTAKEPDPLTEEERQALLQVRKELADAVFDGLDAGATGKLGSDDVRELADLLGFACDDDVWEEEFKEVAAACQWDAQGQVTKEQLMALFDREDGPAPCDNGTLEDLAAELKKRQDDAQNGTPRPSRVVGAVWKCSPKTQAFLDKTPREKLIQRVFELLDTSDSGFMGEETLYKYALLFGFDGTREEWAVEYKCMGKEYGFAPGQGAALSHFQQMVSNHSDGAYADDDGLRRAIASLRSGDQSSLVASRFAAHRYMLRKETLDYRASLPQKELIKKLFATLDVSKSDFLGPDELRRYASMCGFDGDDEDWAVEYAEICMQYNVNPRKGADFEHFVKIVNGKAGQGHATGLDLVDQIEHTKEETLSRMVTFRSAATSRKSRAFTKMSTWLPVADNFQTLRSFALLIRESAADSDSAFMLFTEKRFARLTKEEFFAGLDKLGWDGDQRGIFRLLSLGSNCIVKKHFKWAWNLLDAEELVLERCRRRGETAKSLADRSRVVTEAYLDERYPRKVSESQSITAEDIVLAMS